MRTKINLQLAMLFIAVFIGANTFAQGLYVNAGAGYGFPAACYLMEDNYVYHYDEGGSSWDYEIVKGSGSFGKGIQPGIIIGYMFNPNVGAELGVSYLLGGKIESKDEYHGFYGTETREATHKGTMLRFTPALKMTVGNGNIKPYMRAGLVIGAAGKVKTTQTNTGSGEVKSVVEERESEYTGGISLGFAGALGADFMLSDNIGLFAELGVITQSYAPKKGEWTKYTVDGVDKLGELETYDKEIEFVDSFSDSDDSFDEDSPMKALKMYFPFSSVGVNIGVRIALGGGSE